MGTKIYILITNIFLSFFVLWFFATHRKRNARRILKDKVLNDSDSNYSATAKNIAMSISKAKILYKTLIVKVHPDKFQNHNNKKANDLTARITTAKRNYEKLCKLEIEVNQFLK